MKALRGAAAFRNLREQPLWRLLAATKGPVVIALLQSLFMDTEKELPSSVLHERLTRDLDALRAAGEELPQTPQAYVAEWLSQGWLTRRFPAGASEEEYELSADALTALRFVTGLLKPRTTATESRLSVVMHQLSRLAEDTNTNPQSRLAALRAERDRIDRAIAEVERGGIKVLAPDHAVERAREVIALAQELAADFRSVRDEFERLNRGLRQSLLENEGSRGDVLEQLFSGVDLIGESDAGRTFHAFWRLLTDSEQAATLRESLDVVTGRPFARQLESQERKFLLGLTGALLNEGRRVHDVLQHFARSLSHSFSSDRDLAEERFKALAALVKRLASQETADKNWRNLVLDVRQHVEFVARELDEDDLEVEVYRSGAGKSGGQRQKLAATCLAAALRYQLGGQDRTLPRYSTVVLDEAFDKADADFTAMAMNIFKTFGFQMIVATPLKSVMTLEPFIGGACFVHIKERKKSAVILIEYDSESHRLKLTQDVRNVEETALP